MNTRSYFSVNKEQFFFDIDDVEEVLNAYCQALSRGGHITVFRLPEKAGPWDLFPIIGYRSIPQIERDIALCNDLDEMDALEDELIELHDVYLSSGRDSLPVVEEAA